jgi:hypothetical protein
MRSHLDTMRLHLDTMRSHPNTMRLHPNTMRLHRDTMRLHPPTFKNATLLRKTVLSNLAISAYLYENQNTFSKSAYRIVCSNNIN